MRPWWPTGFVPRRCLSMALDRRTFRHGWLRPARRYHDTFRWEPWSMRRFAFPCLCLVLSACEYNTWSNPPFSSGNNPNMPIGDSENMRRVIGEQVETAPLTPEPGDIWPGPLPPATTLEDLESQSRQLEPQRPKPGSPLYTPGSQLYPNQPP